MTKDNQLSESSPLNIDRLEVSYGDFKAVNNLSFNLEKGEIFGLLGPNGAGKTSAIKCIVTLEKPSSGDIQVFGSCVVKSPLKIKQDLGYVPQEVINHGFFTAAEILSFHSGYFGKKNNKGYIDYLLNRLGLFEHRNKKVKQLSGGMKRRLMIAKALVHQPKLILLDEPTAGVDIELRNSLWDFVKELRDQGTSILLTTHYLEEAEALCDRIAIIHKGRLLKIGQTKDLIKDLTQRSLKIDFSKKVDIKHESLVAADENSLTFNLPARTKIGDILKDLKESVSDIEDIHLVEGNLEEAFKKIMERA